MLRSHTLFLKGEWQWQKSWPGCSGQRARSAAKKAHVSTPCSENQQAASPKVSLEKGIHWATTSSGLTPMGLAKRLSSIHLGVWELSGGGLNVVPWALGESCCKAPGSQLLPTCLCRCAGSLPPRLLLRAGSPVSSAEYCVSNWSQPGRGRAPACTCAPPLYCHV